MLMVIHEFNYKHTDGWFFFYGTNYILAGDCERPSLPDAFHLPCTTLQTMRISRVVQFNYSSIKHTMHSKLSSIDVELEHRLIGQRFEICCAQSEAFNLATEWQRQP